MHIDLYEFGHLVIDGVSYRQDVLLWPGGMSKNWWRRQSHLLQVEDVFEALATAPEVLVVGQGQPGRMQVDPGLADHLRSRGIELVAVPTAEACRIINSLAGKRRLAAALHLTC
jgi:hypothetical protein